MPILFCSGRIDSPNLSRPSRFITMDQAMPLLIQTTIHTHTYRCVSTDLIESHPFRPCRRSASFLLWSTSRIMSGQAFPNRPPSPYHIRPKRQAVLILVKSVRIDHPNQLSSPPTISTIPIMPRRHISTSRAESGQIRSCQIDGPCSSLPPHLLSTIRPFPSRPRPIL